MEGAYFSFTRENEIDTALGGAVYVAGERVKPGLYRQIGGQREVVIGDEDFLPASMDGTVACYECVINMWDQGSPFKADGDTLPNP